MFFLNSEISFLPRGILLISSIIDPQFALRTSATLSICCGNREVILRISALIKYLSVFLLKSPLFFAPKNKIRIAETIKILDKIRFIDLDK